MTKITYRDFDDKEQTIRLPDVLSLTLLLGVFGGAMGAIFGAVAGACLDVVSLLRGWN